MKGRGELCKPSRSIYTPSSTDLPFTHFFKKASAEAVVPLNSPTEITRISSAFVDVLFCPARLDLIT